MSCFSFSSLSSYSTAPRGPCLILSSLCDTRQILCFWQCSWGSTASSQCRNCARSVFPKGPLNLRRMRLSMVGISGVTSPEPSTNDNLGGKPPILGFQHLCYIHEIQRLRFRKLIFLFCRWWHCEQKFEMAACDWIAA